jgi:hypothetical protein
MMKLSFSTTKRLKFPLIFEITIKLSDQTEYSTKYKWFNKGEFKFDYNGKEVRFQLEEKHFRNSIYRAIYKGKELFEIKKGLFDTIVYQGVEYQLRDWKGFSFNVFDFSCRDSLISSKLFQCMLKGSFSDKYKLESLTLIFYLMLHNRLNDGG